MASWIATLLRLEPREHAHREAQLKRHSPRGNAPRPAPRHAVYRNPSCQLSLPFGPGHGRRGRRALAVPASAASRAGRCAPRRPPARSGWRRRSRRRPTDVATALALYLPPGKTLELRLTNNHYSMISVRRKPDGYRLRLHRMFVGAEPRTVRALARYVVHNDRRASTLLGDYIERAPAHHPPAAAPAAADEPAHGGPVPRPAGDLRSAERRALRRRRCEARITWGPVAARGKRRRSIKMGSFAVEDRIIRIHPALDQECVPDYFVAWIVFHEMLHGKHEVQARERPPPLPQRGVPGRGAASSPTTSAPAPGRSRTSIACCGSRAQLKIAHTRALRGSG